MDEHTISRRTLLQGAAGLGLAAATGTLLTACGQGGGKSVEESAPGPDAPLETTAITLFALPPANCIAPQYMAETFLREEGFTDIKYPSFSPKDALVRLSSGEVNF